MSSSIVNSEYSELFCECTRTDWPCHGNGKGRCCLKQLRLAVRHFETKRNHQTQCEHTCNASKIAANLPPQAISIQLTNCWPKRPALQPHKESGTQTYCTHRTLNGLRRHEKTLWVVEQSTSQLNTISPLEKAVPRTRRSSLNRTSQPWLLSCCGHIIHVELYPNYVAVCYRTM